MRLVKQFLYGIFYLILWVGIGTGVYFLFVKPAPTCFDNLKNQNEEGVDCGGICGTECIPALQPLAAVNVSALPLSIGSSTRISFAAEVRNPNGEWAAKDFTYTFHGFDAEGAEVATISGSSYIYAGEIKSIAEPNLPASSTVRSATLTFDSPLWKKQADFYKPDITVNLTGTDQNQALVARGTVLNNGGVPVNVDLVALFYDAQGSLQGASVSSLEGLAARETREFAIFHPILDTVSPGLTKISASAYIVK